MTIETNSEKEGLHKTEAHKIDEQWIPGVRGYHEAAGAIILAADTGRLLLQLRSSTSNSPNTYGQFGGSVDGNEEIFQAVKREIEEETGYDGPLTLRPLSIYQDSNKGFKYYNYVGVVPFEFDPYTNDESAGYIWFDYPNFPEPLHPGLKETLNNVFDRQTLEYCVENRKIIKGLR